MELEIPESERPPWEVPEKETLGNISLRDFFLANSVITWQDAVLAIEREGNTVIREDQIIAKLVFLRVCYADTMLKARESTTKGASK